MRGAPVMAFHRVGGTIRSPTLLDSASITTGKAGSSPSSAARRRVSNSFWLGWGRPGQGAEERAAMAGEPLEIQGLNAQGREPAQDLGLGATGAAIQEDDAQTRLGVIEGAGDMPPPGPVAAGDHRGPPAHLGEHRGHGVRPLPAAPAIDQGRVGAGLLLQRAFQMSGDVARHIGGADPPRRQSRVLDIDRPHLARARRRSGPAGSRRPAHGPARIRPGCARR